EQALTELVAAVRQGASRAVGIRRWFEMLAGFNGAAAPRASGELIWSADTAADELIATGLLDRFDRVIGAVGGRATTYPKSDPKRRVAPTLVAVFECLAPDRLARTNERRRPLELLNREQSQRIPHQHGHAFVAFSARYDALQSPKTHRVGGQPQVG